MPVTLSFPQSLTTDATVLTLESSIIESDKELMMPKRSVVSSNSAARYHQLTHVSGDGYIDLQVFISSLFRFNTVLFVTQSLHHIIAVHENLVSGVLAKNEILPPLDS